jgi:hypothetical protein
LIFRCLKLALCLGGCPLDENSMPFVRNAGRLEVLGQERKIYHLAAEGPRVAKRSALEKTPFAGYEENLYFPAQGNRLESCNGLSLFCDDESKNPIFFHTPEFGGSFRSNPARSFAVLNESQRLSGVFVCEFGGTIVSVVDLPQCDIRMAMSSCTGKGGAATARVPAAL